MSKVLLVTSMNGLDSQIVDPKLNLTEEVTITGVIRTDFDKDESGSTRVSPNIDPVLRIGDVNHIVGKLLTLADASFADVDQRNAFKDLLKQAVWAHYEAISEPLSRAVHNKD